MAFLKWQRARKPGAWQQRNEPPGPKPPDRVEKGQLRVTFVNHATVLIQQDGLNILTDPIWSERTSPVSWVGPAPATTRPASSSRTCPASTS